MKTNSSYNKSKGQLLGHKDIKLSFLKKEYFHDLSTHEITCTLTCRLNMHDLEKKCLSFNNNLIKRICDGLLDTYTISTTEPVIYNTENDLTVFTKRAKKIFGYMDIFKVIATAKVSEGDEFNETKGRMLAEAKAKKKAYDRASKILERIAVLFEQLASAFSDYQTDMIIYSDDEMMRYIELSGIPYTDISDIASDVLKNKNKN